MTAKYPEEERSFADKLGAEVGVCRILDEFDPEECFEEDFEDEIVAFPLVFFNNISSSDRSFLAFFNSGKRFSTTGGSVCFSRFFSFFDPERIDCKVGASNDASDGCLTGNFNVIVGEP